ncbi:MrcB family domain-containing protein [Psychrobacter sp. 219-2-C]|uniref:MrcB family domain-containing protein n=1 Tax=Psychrobacter sp. 219-2-C TaxID=3414707 RepID=UPI003C6DC59B
MQKLLLNILENYKLAKLSNLTDHELAVYVRQQSADILANTISIDSEKYKVKASVGQGQWADVPWIAVFDKSITQSATEGYYIVYLFRADMSGVYLSLNQGWTYFKNRYKTKLGREKITQVSDVWKNELSSTLNDFSYEKINLKNEGKMNSLVEGYELGHICGKFYSVEDMPSSEELGWDLQNLIGVYREIKGKLKQGSVEKTNDYLIVNSNMGLLDVGKTEDDSYGIESSIENYNESKLNLNSVPMSFAAKEQKSRSFTPKKIDFIKQAKSQKKLGYAGELIVLKYEKDFLERAGKSNLMKKVKHVSDEEGDGAGYDILSFDLDGNEKYIEVKTTKFNSDTPFYLTDNELEFSKKEASNYYLYRVYDFDIQENQAKLYILHGDLTNILSLKPQNYIVEGLLCSK